MDAEDISAPERACGCSSIPMILSDWDIFADV